MSYIRYIPYQGNLYEVSTTTDIENQLWQELTMLRHEGANGVYGKLVTAPYIDQAKTYYLDARSSNWKSSGLLYYYSFLNLAKTYLVINRAVSGNNLKSTSVYHGLSANPQNPNSIIDFQLQIHPPNQNRKKNVFSLFYEKFTGENWPFNNTLTIEIRDIIKYCDDISHETNSFYGINSCSFLVQSLIRLTNTQIWFELVVPDPEIPTIQASIGHGISSVIPFVSMTAIDKQIWFDSYKREPFHLKNHSLVRINTLPITAANRDTQFSVLKAFITNLFKDYIVALPKTSYQTYLFQYWGFVPKINLNGTDIKWHPLLSNYLYSFMLSTVLRYHPHLFSQENKDTFISNAWCSQSAISTLRYFLMNISNKQIRLN